ncbi:poly-gamma-glutamate hydrolase family protein [Halopelagius longus]|nr:poly-gamma-glutamate hydrolase family protein [Halopelagius longus]
MDRSGITVEKNNGDAVVRSDEERCNVSDAVLDEAGVSTGEQIRVRDEGGASKYTSGLYTVAGNCRRADTVEMGTDGLRRMAFDRGAAVSVRAGAPHPAYETRAEARANDEYVELLRDGGSGLVACAPHGGYIEYRTDRQAARVAETLDATEWSCVGYNDGGGAYDRWHVGSTDIDRRSFPKLDEIADRGFDHAVSFHGFSTDAIAVGGGAPEPLRLAVRDAIDEATGGRYDVRLADEDGPYGGDSPENFVNWLTADGNGVQIEQSSDARSDDWDTIADAVAEVYEPRL